MPESSISINIDLEIRLCKKRTNFLPTPFISEFSRLAITIILYIDFPGIFS